MGPTDSQMVIRIYNSAIRLDISKLVLAVEYMATKSFQFQCSDFVQYRKKASVRFYVCGSHVHYEYDGWCTK